MLLELDPKSLYQMLRSNTKEFSKRKLSRQVKTQWRDVFQQSAHSELIKLRNLLQHLPWEVLMDVLSS